MDVFLVPVGDPRYVLYCEVQSRVPPEVPDEGRGLWRRVLDQYRRVLVAVEREEQRRHQGAQVEQPNRGVWHRFKRRCLKWLAEKVAEQRLLWTLRHTDGATLVYPDDLEAGEATACLRRLLAQDLRRHSIWLAVNAIGFVASGLLMPIPGPNLLAYYFAFRLVGHSLAARGAWKGRTRIDWSVRPSPVLSSLRGTEALDPAARARRLQDAATALGLAGLPAFFERTAPFTACYTDAT